MNDDDEKPGRPLAVTLLWVLCGLSILIAAGTLLLGVFMIVDPAEFGPKTEKEMFLVLGSVIVLCSVAVIIFHTVPFFLRPKPSSWKYINGFLIASIVVWALLFTPCVIVPLPVMVMWANEDVKLYFGVVRRGRDRDDDGWDEEWDRRRRRDDDDDWNRPRRGSRDNEH